MKTSAAIFASTCRALIIAYFLIATPALYAQKFNDGDGSAMRMLVFNVAMDEVVDALQKVDIELSLVSKLQMSNQQKLKIINYIGTYKREANNLLDATKVVDSAIRLALLVDAEKDIRKLRAIYVSQICFNMPSRLHSGWYDDSFFKSRLEVSRTYGKEVFASIASINAVDNLIEKTNLLGIKFNSICNDIQNLNNW